MVSDEKLFKIAVAYYKNRKTQQSIADELGVSHVQVGKYLKLAKERGIVEITINAPFIPQDEERKYSLYLRELFGLESLVLTPSAANDRLTSRFLTEGACEFLLARFPNKDLKIALGMGKTINDISKFRPRTADKRNCWEVYPVTNYPVRSGSFTYFSYENLVRDFSENWGSRRSRSFMDSVKKGEDIDLSQYWKDLDVVVGGVGLSFSRDPEARETLLGKREAEIYSSVDILGDYLNYFFDDGGHVLRPVTMGHNAISLETLRKVPVRMAVAYGFSKVFSIIGLLRCNIINTLVTDLTTARNIVETLK